MSRLALAGKSLLEKAVTMHTFLKYRGDLNLEELNKIKNNIVNDKNLQSKFQ
jgi:dsRNA-specific ribonuclease